MSSPWIEHVRSYRAMRAMEGFPISYQQALIEAKPSYQTVKQRRAPDILARQQARERERTIAFITKLENEGKRQEDISRALFAREARNRRNREKVRVARPANYYSKASKAERALITEQRRIARANGPSKQERVRAYAAARRERTAPDRLAKRQAREAERDARFINELRNKGVPEGMFPAYFAARDEKNRRNRERARARALAEGPKPPGWYSKAAKAQRSFLKGNTVPVMSPEYINAIAAQAGY